jgi:hypothetical protein
VRDLKWTKWNWESFCLQVRLFPPVSYLSSDATLQVQFSFQGWTTNRSESTVHNIIMYTYSTAEWRILKNSNTCHLAKYSLRLKFGSVSLTSAYDHVRSHRQMPDNTLSVVATDKCRILRCQLSPKKNAGYYVVVSRHGKMPDTTFSWVATANAGYYVVTSRTRQMPDTTLLVVATEKCGILRCHESPRKNAGYYAVTSRPRQMPDTTFQQAGPLPSM